MGGGKHGCKEMDLERMENFSEQPCPKRGLEKQSRRWKVMWGPGVGVTTYLYTDGNDSVGES